MSTKPLILTVSHPWIHLSRCFYLPLSHSQFVFHGTPTYTMNAARARGRLMKWQLVGVAQVSISSTSTGLILQWERVDPSGGGPAAHIWHHLESWHSLAEWHRLSHTHTPAIEIRLRWRKTWGVLGGCVSQVRKLSVLKEVCVRMCWLVGGLWVWSVKQVRSVKKQRVLKSHRWVAERTMVKRGK